MCPINKNSGINTGQQWINRVNEETERKHISMIKWQKDFEKARALTFNAAQNKEFLTTLHDYWWSLSS